ncbi:MAG TPA: hypothetical protein VFA60_06180 [Terriglobales bacterium]|nr:hypothetical protein [Terriglobales bacterium]
MATPQAAPLVSLGFEGDELRVPQGATLPNFCVKCGAPGTKPLDKNFFWHNKWLFLLILISPIIYIIVALIVRKKMHLVVPLCDQHSAARKRNIWIGVAMLAVWLPLGITGSAIGGDIEPAAWLLGMALFVAGIIVISMSAAVLRPTYIDPVYGKFTGASQEFRSRLV